MDLRLRYLISLILLCITIHGAYPFPQSQKYIEWKNVSSAELNDRCYELCTNSQNIDSAFIYATVVSKRYSPDLDVEEKILCAKAYTNLWYLCFTYYNDFSKAFYYILQAEKIKNELKVDIPVIDMDMGCFYDFISGQSNEKSFQQKALHYYTKAIESSLRTEDINILNSSFFNIITLLMDFYPDTKHIWDIYNSATFASNNKDYLTYKKLYKALQLAHDGKYQESVDILNKVVIPDSFKNNETMFRCIIENLKSNVYEVNGLYDKAISYMKEAESIADKSDIYEIQYYAYKKNSELYNLINDNDNHIKYKNKYLSLKDSVMGYGQISSISKMKFIGQIDEMNVEITEIKQRHKLEIVILYVVVLILLTVVIVSFILYLKNKQISKKNEMLYNNYNKICRVEEELRNKIKEDSNVADDSETEIKEERHKYTKSSLSEKKKTILLDKILTVMEDTELICSTSFSTDVLAERVGISYKYISQVINEKYDYSFNILLNRYRIKEVCKRLKDVENYGSYTTEAIAQSVGFKNRTTFINAFKKETGMTPYQYLKFVKNDKGNIYR